jgi:hypothetical protein
MYQQIKPMFADQSAQCIKRIADNAYIPLDPANTDYQEYLVWLAEGNEPLPPDGELVIAPAAPQEGA